MRRTVLILAIGALIVSGQGLADMEPTAAVRIGDLPDNQPITYHECHDDRVLTGIEVRYNALGIGQIRSFCREWEPDPDNPGYARILPGGLEIGWSTVADETGFSAHRSMNCRNGLVVKGFLAKGGADQLKGLKLACDRLRDDGSMAGEAVIYTNPTGPGGNTYPWAGPLWCGEPWPAQGFFTRSSDRLLSFGLLCGQAMPTMPHYQAYDIDGNDLIEMINLAGRNRGLGFRCQMLPESTRETRCRFAMEDGPPRMEIEFPHNGSPLLTGPSMMARAAFRFFTFVPGPHDTGDLVNRWRVEAIEFRRMDVEADDDPLASCSPQVVNEFEEGNPYYEVQMHCESPTSLYVVQYALTRITLIGPEGEQWEDAFAAPAAE